MVNTLIWAARVLSIVLGIAAAGAFLTAVSAFFTIGPSSGALGVVLVDSLFATFILFAASRFLWIYASRRSLQRQLEERGD